MGELKTFPGRRQVQRLNVMFSAPACLPGAFLLQSWSDSTECSDSREPPEMALQVPE